MGRTLVGCWAIGVPVSESILQLKRYSASERRELMVWDVRKCAGVCIAWGKYRLQVLRPLNAEVGIVPSDEPLQRGLPVVSESIYDFGVVAQR